jgi:polyhydroxyalkanoate synthesis regulator phasin
MSATDNGLGWSRIDRQPHSIESVQISLNLASTRDLSATRRVCRFAPEVVGLATTRTHGNVPAGSDANSEEVEEYSGIKRDVATTRRSSLSSSDSSRSRDLRHQKQRDDVIRPKSCDRRRDDERGGVFSRMSEEARRAVDELHRQPKIITSCLQKEQEAEAETEDKESIACSDAIKYMSAACSGNTTKSRDQQQNQQQHQRKTLNTLCSSRLRNVTQETPLVRRPEEVMVAEQPQRLMMSRRYVSAVASAASDSIWLTDPPPTAAVDGNIGDFRITSASYDSRYADIMAGIGRCTNTDNSCGGWGGSAGCDVTSGNCRLVDELIRREAVQKCTTWLRKQCYE